jgi:predicted acetyltransferase
MSDFQYGPLHVDDELPAFERMMAQALVIDLAWMAFWIGASGAAECRVVRDGSRLAAGACRFRVEQFFGGRGVPNVGINGVGVAPEARGRGVGKRLMRGVLEELHADGVALSILYPSTMAFYRSVGFERGGTRISYELPLRAIPFNDHGLEIVEAGRDDHDAIRHVYLAQARHTNGQFDRATFLWERLLHGPDKARSYLAQRNGEAVGYVIFTQGSRSDPLRVLDFCALNDHAGRCLLTLLADHRTMIDKLIWNGSPTDRVLRLLPENSASITHSFDWLLRIVELRAALEARGYPAALEAEVHLDIADELLPANAGRWVLRVADGRGTVERGGKGDLRLGVRELASIYSGFLSPAEIGFVGAIDGPDRARSQLGLIFSGPTPRQWDSF